MNKFLEGIGSKLDYFVLIIFGILSTLIIGFILLAQLVMGMELLLYDIYNTMGEGGYTLSIYMFNIAIIFSYLVFSLIYFIKLGIRKKEIK